MKMAPLLLLLFGHASAATMTETLDELNTIIGKRPQEANYGSMRMEPKSACRVELVHRYPSWSSPAGLVDHESRTELDLTHSVKLVEAGKAYWKSGYGTEISSPAVVIRLKTPARKLLMNTVAQTSTTETTLNYVDSLAIAMPGSASSEVQRAVQQFDAAVQLCADQQTSEILRPAAITADEQYALGTAYQLGRDIVQNLEQAVYWLEKAAEQGHMKAQLYLGSALRSGRGVNKDMVKARYWFEKAEAQGSDFAADFLGDIYLQGAGIAADPARAAPYFRKAALADILTAQESLGEMLQFGRGVPKNLEEAAFWYEKAVSKGSESASTNLGSMYAQGAGVEKDTARAHALFRSAARKGYAPALHNLGEAYRTGEVSPTTGGDAYSAYICYQLAAKSGMKAQPEQLAEVAKALTQREIAKADALVGQWSPPMPLPGD